MTARVTVTVTMTGSESRLVVLATVVLWTGPGPRCRAWPGAAAQWPRRALGNCDSVRVAGPGGPGPRLVTRSHESGPTQSLSPILSESDSDVTVIAAAAGRSR